MCRDGCQFTLYFLYFEEKLTIYAFSGQNTNEKYFRKQGDSRLCNAKVTEISNVICERDLDRYSKQKKMISGHFISPQYILNPDSTIQSLSFHKAIQRT